MYSVWDVYQQLENSCGTIKYNSENVDLDHIRGVMRQAQEVVLLMNRFKNPERVEAKCLERGFSEDSEYAVTITVNVNSDDVEMLIRTLWPAAELDEE
jgi:hypothetical protein